MSETPDWKVYEKAIAIYWRKMGYEVLEDQKLSSKSTGRPSQVDVIAECDLPHLPKVTIAIEAKLHKGKLDVDVARSIVAKFAELPVDFGFVYCTGGFTSGALALFAAQNHPKIYCETAKTIELIRSSWGSELLEILRTLDEAKSNPDPSAQLIAQVAATLEETPEMAKFFFTGLDGPRWLRALHPNGVLHRMVQKQLIPAAHFAVEYAVRHTLDVPEALIDLADAVTGEDGWIQADLLRPAATLPPVHLKAMATAIGRWHFRSFYDTQALSKFIGRLVDASMFEEAIEIAAAASHWSVPKNRTPSAAARFDLQSDIGRHHLKLLLDGLPAILAPVAPRELLGFASDRLDKITRDIDPKGRRVCDRYTRSRIDRANFVTSDDLLDLWIDLYRDSLLATARRHPLEAIEHCKAVLAGDHTGAHKRTVLFVVEREFASIGTLYDDLLAHGELWADTQFLTELHALVVGNWDTLNGDQRRRTVMMICSLLNVGAPKRIDPVSAEDYRKRRTVDWLLRLDGLVMPAEVLTQFKELLANLEEETGMTEAEPEPSPPKVVGVNSEPDWARALPDLDPHDAIRKLAEFVPDESRYPWDTPQGAAAGFKKAVSARPVDYLARADRVGELQYPAYAQAFIDALSECARTGRFEWDMAEGLRFAIESAERDWGGHTSDLRGSMAVGSAHWVIDSACALIEDALHAAEVPRVAPAVLEYALDVWDRLFAVASDESGFVEDPPTQIGSNWMSRVINSDHGHLGMALGYALERAHQGTVGGAEELREQYALLEDRCYSIIDKVILPSKSNLLRAPMGMFITAMYHWNRRWAEERRRQLLDQSDTIRWEAVWSMHFWMTSRSFPVFQLLEGEYLYGISLVDNEPDSRPPAWFSSIGDDVALFMQSGDLPAEATVVNSVLKAKCHEARSRVAHILGKTLAEDGREAWDRFLSWWRAVYNLYTPGALGEAHEDLAAFNRWVQWIPDDIQLSTIVDPLVASFAAECTVYPPEALDFLAKRCAVEPGPCAAIVRAMATASGRHPWMVDDEAVADLVLMLLDAGATDPVVVQNLKAAVSDFLQSVARIAPYEAVRKRLERLTD